MGEAIRGHYLDARCRLVVTADSAMACFYVEDEPATLTGSDVPVRIVDWSHVPESRGGPSYEVRWEAVP
jgi:hypothetical protein